MTKDMKSKAVYAAIIAVLCLIFVCLFGFGLKKVLAMEGAFPPVVNVDGVTPAPESKDEVIDFLNRALNNAIESKPKLSSSDSFSIDDESIKTSGSDAFRQNLLFFKGNFIAKLSESRAAYDGNFGDDITSQLNIPDIAAPDIESFECDYIYYACTSCGHGEKEQLSECGECGNPYPYALKYRDEYEIRITVKASDRITKTNFKERTDGEIKALYEAELENYLSVDKLDISHDKLEIIYKVNRLTDKLTSLEYKKTMTVNANVTFEGEFEKAGKSDLSFALTESERFVFVWPGIELSAHTFSVEPKTTNNLTAKLSCDDPAKPEYVVTWSSSDESLFTIDSEGYIKSGKNTGTATVTASFVFQGVTYTDTCEVTVKIPAESSEISKKKLELNIGDSAELEVKVLPKDTTIKTVKWYSENAGIAAVDENGRVTAIAGGKTTVYSLTDDGYFKSSCEVTVK